MLRAGKRKKGKNSLRKWEKFHKFRSLLAATNKTIEKAKRKTLSLSSLARVKCEEVVRLQTKEEDDAVFVSFVFLLSAI